MPITKRPVKRRVRSFQTSVKEESPVEVAPQNPTPAIPTVPPLTPVEQQQVPPVPTPPVVATPEPVPQLEEEILVEDDQKEGISNVKLFFLVAGIVALVALLLGGGGYFLYSLGVQHGEQKAREAAMQHTPTPTVLPAEGKTVDKKEYSIKVLNGSGIAGEAARVQGELEKEGYTVSSVGNADEDNMAETVIQAKKSVNAAWVAVLQTFLEKQYKTVTADELAKSNSLDVIITLGNGKK